MFEVFARSPGLYLYFAVMVFWFGACLGSFLNVCIYRIPMDFSVVTPRSHCPGCKTQIAWYDNIPLVSWLALKARCRHCGIRISVRYIGVEFLTAVLFLLVWLKYGAAGLPRPLGLVGTEHFAILPVYWLVIFGLLLATFVDFDHMIIPDRVSLGGVVLGLALAPCVPALHLQPNEGSLRALDALIRAAVGAAAGAGSLYAIGCLGKVAFKKDAMGLGDVKLLGAIGAFLGWQSIVATILISSFLGAVAGIGLIVAGRKELSSRIPFGPYIAMAAVIWMLWGSRWWYLWVNHVMNGSGY